MTNTATNTVHPERQRRVAKSLKFYSITAILTGIWLLILVAKMVAKYLIFDNGTVPEWVDYIGIAHGLFYMLYMIASLDLGTKARWEPVKWLTTILAGVVPFLSFYVERKRRHEVEEAFDLKNRA